MTKFTQQELESMCHKLARRFKDLGDEFGELLDDPVSLTKGEIKDFLEINNKGFKAVKYKMLELGYHFTYNSNGYFLGLEGSPAQMYVHQRKVDAGIRKGQRKIIISYAQNTDSLPAFTILLEKGTKLSIEELVEEQKQWKTPLPEVIVIALLGPGN